MNEYDHSQIQPEQGTLSPRKVMLPPVEEAPPLLERQPHQQEGDRYTLASPVMDLSRSVDINNKDDEDYDSVSSHDLLNAKEKMGAKELAAAQERQTLGRKESQAICCMRIIVLTGFVLLGLITSLGVLAYVYKRQVENYKTNFGIYSEQVLDSFAGAFQKKMNSIDTLSTRITAHALSHNMEFPFVTIPYFEILGSNARITGDQVTAFYLPHVTEEKRLQWENYTAVNGHHYLETYHREEELKARQDKKTSAESEGEGAEALAAGDLNIDEEYVGAENGIYEKIWFPSSEVLQGPYYPIWHLSPLLPPAADMINLDMGKLSFSKESLPVVLEKGEACIDVIMDLGSLTGSETKTFDLIIDYGQHRHASENYQDDALSVLNYPVFDRFPAGGPDDEERKPVGSILSSIYWRFLFRDILPESIVGLVCVIENNFGQHATFKINGGEDVEYLGADYLHNVSAFEEDLFFSKQEASQTLGELLLSRSSVSTESFTAVDLNSDVLNYTLTIYPSEEFVRLFVNNESGADAAVVFAIFLVCIVLFLLYDYCVRRRQSIVMDRAVKSTAVVSSLFPEAVRDRILNEDDHTANESNRGSSATFKQGVNSGMTSTRPIADKFTDCTVLFADLAGFTNWSATREPEAVFVLLESLFKAFDAIALKRGVFKVETIGDCYMAVTGLPFPQPNHAIRMSKFAYDCMEKIIDVTGDLAPRLGEGTEDLTLRIGLHSGEVTAGVLRGEKGRFQLFGDTVNTASRMESNGKARRIQVSQSTADALILGGKASWLIPRVDKVEAKGKGDMQTYWLQVKDRASTNSMGTSARDSVTALVPGSSPPRSQ